MKKSTIAYLVGGAALYWWLSKKGGLKGLGYDIFGSDIAAAGVPYNFFTQQIYNPYAPPPVVAPPAPPPPVWPYGYPMPPGYPPVAWPYQGMVPAPGFTFNPYGGQSYFGAYVPEVVTASGGIQGMR